MNLRSAECGRRNLSANVAKGHLSHAALLKNALSKVLREKDVLSPHWQKGFFDHILRSGDSYSEKWEYVRENPVRASLVKAGTDWPFVGEIFDLEFRQGAG